MSSRSVVTSTLVTPNQDTDISTSQTGQMVRNPQIRPSYSSRLLSFNIAHDSRINIIPRPSASLRSIRPVNNNRNKSSYSKTIDTTRNVTSSLDSSSCGASNKNRNKSPYSKTIDITRNFSTSSVDSSSSSSSNNNLNKSYSKSIAITRNFSASSLESSSSTASYNSNNLSQFSDKSFASSTTSFQSSASPSPGRNLADFDILKLLGTGGTARVYLARDKRTESLVALKVISKTGRNKDQLNDVINEQKIHRLVSDPADQFILPILGSWHDELNFFIVTEFIPGSDLAVETMKSRKLGEEAVRFYAAELVVALDSLHKRNIIHRDVKPGNILLDADGHIRLCDYGSAIAFDEPTAWREKQEPIPAFITFDVDGTCDSGAFLKPSMEPVFMANDTCGTPYFMSPEQHRGKDYSFDADIWGLGVTMFRMLTGRMPFGDHVQHKENIKGCVLSDPLVFRPSDDISPVTRAFLEGLLAKRARDRLSMAEIKTHPYFKGVDWNHIAKRGLSCPSKPYVSPVPKYPKDIPPTIPGKLYSCVDDPFPLFHYSSEELDRPSPPSPILVEQLTNSESKYTIFKHAGRFFQSLLSKSEKEKTPQPTFCPKSQALRPLLLPSIVSNECSTSPPSEPTVEGFAALQSSRLSGTELVPPRPRRQLSAFAGSGFQSPPSPALSRAGSYVPRKASPLQKSHSLPSPPSPPQIKVSRPCSAKKETRKSVSSLRTSSDSSPRNSALERFKGWKQRLSCVTEDPRGDHDWRKEKGKMPVDEDDEDDEDGWDFRCKGDPDDPLMQCTISEE